MNAKVIFEDFVSLFFPRLCIHCDAPLPKGLKYICLQCQYNLPKTENFKEGVPKYEEKFEGIFPIRVVFVYGHFVKGGVMQAVLHELKYNHNQEIGIQMGRWFGKSLSDAGWENAFDVIIPVPLHPQKLKKRGYNQALAIAQGLYQVLGLTILENALYRVRNTTSQTRKKKRTRILEMDGVFELRGDVKLKQLNILLVDDVLTTGSTLLACAEQLQKAHPKSISIATLAGA